MGRTRVGDRRGEPKLERWAGLDWTGRRESAKLPFTIVFDFDTRITARHTDASDKSETERVSDETRQGFSQRLCSPAG